MFDKSSTNEKNYSPKPRTATGDEMHNTDSVVTLNLYIDEQNKTVELGKKYHEECH